MKISRYGIIGAMIGYFVISPLIFYPNLPASFLSLLIYNIGGLVIVTLIGILIGYTRGED